MSTHGKRVRTITFFAVEVCNHFEDGNYYRRWVSFVFPGFRLEVQRSPNWKRLPKVYIYNRCFDAYLPGLTIEGYLGSETDNTGCAHYSGDATEEAWKWRKQK